MHSFCTVYSQDYFYVNTFRRVDTKMWNSNLVREDLKVAMDTNFCNYISEKAYTATINLSSYQFESRAWDINLHLLKTRI